jgi:polyisoprenyl-phosphate glycosyltransferase
MVKNISVIIPSFNEEENIKELYERIVKVLDEININDYEIIFIENGSSDNSFNILKNINALNNKVKIVSFSRNFGYQNAILAGLEYSKKDHACILDGDLQDPPEIIKDFILKADDGFDVVYGVRKKREATFFKKISYKLFYFVYQKLSEISVPKEVGEFCLINRKVINHLIKLREKNLFIRGLRSWVGFNQTGIEYNRMERNKGNAKFSLYGSFILGLDGIISFTLIPLRIALILGLILFVISIIYFLFVFITKLLVIFGFKIPLWLIMPKGLTIMNLIMVTFLSLIVLILGIIGEYIGKIYTEVKDRPRYIVKEFIE